MVLKGRQLFPPPTPTCLHANVERQREECAAARNRHPGAHACRTQVGAQAGPSTSADARLDICHEQHRHLQYNVILSALYILYSPAQIPSNMILNRITRPSWYIGCCVVAWGLVSLLTSQTRGYSGLVACRIFLGLPEAAFYPGSTYLLSRWYTKKELALRCAILYAGFLLANAFGAVGVPMAGTYSNFDPFTLQVNGRWNLVEHGRKTGDSGLEMVCVCVIDDMCDKSWDRTRLFIIEGSITIALGVFTIWALPDYPNNTSWIVGNERRLAQVRLAEDAGEADQDNAEDTPLRGLKLAALDPLVWAFAIMNMTQIFGLSFVIFFPTLTRSLGFSITISLVLVAPPWLFASAICCLNSWHADATRERYFHIAGTWWVVSLGLIISICTRNLGARYLSMFFMVFGFAGFSLTAVWVSNVIPRPPSKRAAAIAIVNAVGNIGNIIGSYSWKSEWGPLYHQSMIISLCALVLSSVIALGIRQHLVLRNKRLDEDEQVAVNGADEGRVREAAVLEGITFEQAMEKRKGFRYLH
ncbi:MFS general substrate transporter [Roridomyces roridus]|uniref:MFS general substrate transporter n=1 Tax=Roridomyces roridus TaxID=1738132 RepID=A0AAD7FU65_9AGAR|nr:MFS general substrate transporter [Roridomyces roridus]